MAGEPTNSTSVTPYPKLSRTRRWPQRRILEVDLDIEHNGPFAEAPSGHTTKEFGFGRNTDTEPWKITELGFF